MALAGAAAAAARGFLNVPVDGELMNEAARVPMEAGCVAHGITAAILLAAVDITSPTFEQDVRDVCDMATVTAKPLQNIVIAWWRKKLTNPAGPTTNWMAQADLLVRAGVAAGHTSAHTQAQLQALMTQNNAMGSTKDLGKIVYVRALWMNKWLGVTPGIVEESDVQSSKVYRHHSASGGRTLKSELNAGRTAFERYVADVKSGGKDRNEAEFVGAVAEFMEVLPLHCNNNWSLYKSYVLKWMEKHSTTGLATPYDGPLLDQLLKDMVTSQNAEDPSAEAVTKSTEALAEATRVMAAQQTEQSRAVSVQMAKLAEAQRAGAGQQAMWMMPPQGGMMPPYAYPPQQNQYEKRRRELR